MKKELSKTYSPTDVENRWYDIWIKENAFIPKETGKESYTLMMPPPNVTGVLHIGHILNNTIQDVLIRKARMKGKSTLWQPGIDHAAIATEAKVTKLLKEKGIDKKEIKREIFLDHCWAWKEEYGGTILKQLRRLGASCDWDKTKFTLDKDYTNSVLTAFVHLYNKGLIYKGERMVNWDPVSLTALSDEEVIHKETPGNLWYFKYPLKDSKEFLIVATTRPETMLGDTGVAVNPKDKRYMNLIGKTIILPIVKREIPIFSDEYVDMEFGTGCVKVTPAHDSNDFDMGQRNNLDIINIMNPDASLNKNVPVQYQGLDRNKARKQVIDELESLGLLDKIEDYSHQVGYSERSDAIVEPYLSEQWFLKMKEIAKPALKAVHDGEVTFYPERWTKIYNHWLENIKDWCISRQLWWGHQIPVWYKGDEIYCGINPPEGTDWIQDEDVLDTWFSSWLWPFATLGWPQKTKELERFYPTQDLTTGPDIIFFWVARMIMAGYYFMGDKPFSNVYFNGIIRDAQGKKMSKSLGNSPDAVKLMDKYGVDAVRVSLLMIAPQGLDILFSEDRLDMGRNFMNKLWNCSRFILMNLDNDYEEDISKLDSSNLDDSDKWILSKLNTVILDVENSFADYKVNDVIKGIYNFVWKDYCDWYIEFSKSRFYGISDDNRRIVKSISVHLLKSILKLLHPFAPFITEEIWSLLREDNKLLIHSEWPEINNNYNFEKVEKNIELLMLAISSIRNIKTDLGISPKKKINIHCRGKNIQTKIFKSNHHHLTQMLNIQDIECGEKIVKPDQSATAVIKNLEIFLPLNDLIDVNKELERLASKIKDVKARMDNVKKKLDNNNFINKAPLEVVDHEKNKYQAYLNDYNKLIDNYSSISSK